MPGKVVDASALGALAFGEPELELIRAQLSGYDLVAPALLPFELANIAWKKQTREPGRAELLREAWERRR